MGWSIPAARSLGGQEAPGDDLWVREATAADLEAILDIEQAAHPTPWSEDVFRREFELDLSHLWVLGADGSTQPVAFLVFWVVHDEVHVLNVAVAPEFRRRGIATRLIDFLAQSSRTQKASFITLEVRHGNKAAIALYESLGFAIIGRREAYYADTGEDALLMSLLL